MYLLGLGLILLILKWQGIAPFGSWSWWWFALPFVAAVAWWEWADWSGYTKRRAMEREDGRKQERIDRQREALGRKPAGRAAKGRRAR